MKDYQMGFCVVKEAKTIYKTCTNITSVQKLKIGTILKFFRSLVAFGQNIAFRK